jgi:Trypsin-co-occurring domain 2
MGADEKFPLVQLIGALGEQLREAQREAKEDDKPDLLKLKECTIELGITWEKKGEAGLEFWVVKLGGGLTKTDTQTISVTMEPLSTDDVVLELTE